MQKNIKFNVFFNFINFTNAGNTMVFWEILDIYNFV